MAGLWRFRLQIVFRKGAARAPGAVQVPHVSLRCCVNGTKAMTATYDPATAATSLQPKYLRFNRTNFG